MCLKNDSPGGECVFIHSARITNYKSIKDSGTLELDRFSVLAGRNNTGKTAFIEGLSKGFQGNYVHPNTNTQDTGNREAIMQSDPAHLDITFKLNAVDKSAMFTGLSGNLWGEYINLNVDSWNGHTRVNTLRVIESSKWDLYQFLNGTFTFSSTRNSAVPPATIQQLMQQIWGCLSKQIVYIGGHREPVINQTPVEQHLLDSRASNLHRVFHTLLSNDRSTFDEIESVFKEIFTDVKHIHAGLRGNVTHVEIEFEGLSERVRLEQCGTGYTHVLTMLCIVFSDQRPIVLFDEPHSYLHPSAEKALYQLAAGDSRHQYVFTTHSSVLLNYPVSKTIYLITKEEGRSRFTKLDSVRDGLRELGVLNSDFALSDKVLFVEGPTERDVIPLVLAKYGTPKIGFNYTIVSLGGTGSEFKDSGLMARNAKIYESLFQSISATPVPYAIFIDRDERKTETLYRAYKDKLVVLPRRELENYFLVPEAIEAVLASMEIELEPEEVKKFIDNCLADTTDHKLYPKTPSDKPINDIVASEVLERLFRSHYADYSKPTHGLLLASWLLEHDSGDLHEIAALLEPFFQR